MVVVEHLRSGVAHPAQKAEQKEKIENPTAVTLSPEPAKEPIVIPPRTAWHPFPLARSGPAGPAGPARSEIPVAAAHAQPNTLLRDISTTKSHSWAGREGRKGFSSHLAPAGSKA